MRSRILVHLRANTIAYVALFVALGGTSAYAVGQVRSPDIQAGAVRSSDVHNQSLRGVDVASDSLQGRDVDESTLEGQPAAALAHVNADASLDQSLSENVAGVTQIPASPGSYCFKLGQGVEVKNIVATRQEEANENSPLEVVTDLPSTDALNLTDCPVGFRDAFVGFRNTQAGVNAAFFVVFH